MNGHDFIEIYPDAVPAALCAEIIRHMRAAPALSPGRTGGGLLPELKNSRDLDIEPLPEWQQIKQQINLAMLDCLRRYLRRYPYTLIAPLMLQIPGPDGEPRRLGADDFDTLPDDTLTALVTRCFRPGGINLQWYNAGVGGYPYWHCELYPRAADPETLHRHLLWTLYLNDDFNAGETEFFYQQRKITPKTGSLLIAPAAFTHTHRGNQPQDGDKFIATSWILFRPAGKLYGSPG
ncbi:MAG: 2OG-Fe(II) oxygenase [Pseudomonadota bacterium]|nr:2OG-Fe(II) oxygenase [Pseudomonadota bacterium]